MRTNRNAHNQMCPPSDPPSRTYRTNVAFLFLLLSASVITACRSRSVERVFYNATIWTGNSTEPYAEAVAINNGVIVDVGTTDTVLAGTGPSTERVDVKGAFIVPGFTDNHTHFLSGGFQLASVDLRSADSPGEFIRRIRVFASDSPADRWITGGDWDHEAWGGQLPTRSWIDSVTTDRPVFVSRLDGHMGLANTAALSRARISTETPDPAGGTIVRDPVTGEPTGILKDEAMSLVWSVVPDPNDAEMRAAFIRASEFALSWGVTQINDVGSFGGWRDLQVFRDAFRNNELHLRIYSMVPLRTWERMRNYVRENGRGNEWIRWGGLKGYIDGSLGSTTAWFYDPYLDEPETSGLLVADTAAIRNQINQADAAGLQLAIHAIGDQANTWLLDRFEDAVRRNGKNDSRFRIEHAQHLSAGIISRFVEIGVIASMQPYHAIDDGRWAEKRLDSSRIRYTYAFRSLLDAGAALTFGSDWTVAPISPLLGIYAAVTRRTIDGLNPDGWVPEQKVSVEEALRAYTFSNAYAGFFEEKSGKIESGMLADFVILSDNLLEIDPVDIPDVRVLRTVVGGRDRFILDQGNVE